MFCHDDFQNMFVYQRKIDMLQSKEDKTRTLIMFFVNNEKACIVLNINQCTPLSGIKRSAIMIGITFDKRTLSC